MIKDIKCNLLIDEVLFILKECVYDPSGTGQCMREKAKQYVSDKNILAYGYYQGNKIVGIIIVDIINKQEITIKGIAVDQSNRKLGVGSKLIDFIKEKYNPNLLIAETDDDAVGFYRRYGFCTKSLGEKYQGCVRYLCELRPKTLCYCGHDCSRCITYLATVNNDENLRKQAQRFYLDIFGQDIPLDKIRCMGGRSDDVFYLCKGCPWIKCCKEKGISACSECKKYPCKSLAEYQKKYVNKCNQI